MEFIDKHFPRWKQNNHLTNSLFSFSFFFFFKINKQTKLSIAAREQLKQESKDDFQARELQERETKQQLIDMKLNATGRNDITLNDEVLGKTKVVVFDCRQAKH